MAAITRFEDITAWQEARELTKQNENEFAAHYEQARKTKALIGGFKNSLIPRT